MNELKRVTENETKTRETNRRKRGLACWRKARRHGHEAIEAMGGEHLERRDQL